MFSVLVAWALLVLTGFASLLCNMPLCHPDQEIVFSIPCQNDCYHQLCDFMLDDNGFDSCESICASTGCDVQKLGNGLCDADCESAYCAYDRGDCAVCAPGCTADMLANGVCDPICDVSPCAYDNGDCELCASGCLQTQLGNGVCEPECNNLNCHFDGGDCPPKYQKCAAEMIGNGVCNSGCMTEDTYWDGGDCNCAPMCFFQFFMNSECDEECNVPQCRFDNNFCVSVTQLECTPGCSFTMLANGVCDPECGAPECWFDPDCWCSKSCSPMVDHGTDCLFACMTLACDYNNYGAGGCDSEGFYRIAFTFQVAARNYDLLLDTAACEMSGCYLPTLAANIEAGQCTPECNSPQCGYAGGQCTAELHPDCAVGYGAEAGQCFDCRAPLFQYFGFCVEECPRGSEEHRRFPRVCMHIKADGSTKDSPDHISVYYEPQKVESHQGTVYRTLSDALAASWQKYTVISLIGESVLFNPDFVWSQSNIDYVYFRKSLPDLISTARWEYLTLRSQPCAEAELPHCVDTPTTLYFAHIKPINLANRKLTIENVVISTSNYFQYQDIKYCPYLYGNSYVRVNDRGIAMYGMQWTHSQCQNFTSTSLFVVQRGAKLNIIDSHFLNVTVQLKAIVLLSGGDVELQNTNFTNVIPTIDEGAVIFQEGICSDIEHCSNVVYRSGKVTQLNNGYEFLRDTKLNPFLNAEKLTNIELTGVTFTLSAVADVSSSHGLITLKNFLKLSITDCDFTNNFLMGSVLSIGSYVRLPFTRLDTELRYVYYVQRHIDISRTLFQSNFAQRSIVQITMYRDVLNVRIADCRFEGNAVAEGSEVELVNEGILGSAEIEGRRFSGALIAARWVNVTDTVFLRETSFLTLLSFTKVANIYLSGITITESGDRSELSVAAVMRSYIGIEGIYASILPSVAPQHCESLLIFDEVVNIDITEVYSKGNQCMSGGAGVAYSRVNGSNSVKNLWIEDNYGTKASGIAITLGTDVQLTARNLTVKNNIHEDKGAILLVTGSVLLLTDSTFINNIGYSGAAVFSDGALQITISDTVFLQNQVFAGSGGAIFFLSSGSEPSLKLIDCEFNGNRATFGGAIYFSFPLNGRPVLLTVDNSRFAKDFSEAAGSSLFLTNTVQLTATSYIRNSVFTGESSTGGVICLQHISGTLRITNATFSNNRDAVSAGINILTSAQGDTHIEFTEFWSNALGPDIATSNARLHSTFATLNCTFHGGEYPLMSLEGSVWEDYGSRFESCRVTAIESTLGARSELHYASFVSNTSPSSGGAIYASSKSQVECMHCAFLSNSARNGGAIFAEQNSVIRLDGCLFQNNAAQVLGGAVYLISAPEVTSVVSNSEFTGNRAPEGATIASTSSAFQLLSSLTSLNVGEVSAGLSLRMSVAGITSCSFLSQTASESPFISVLTSSSVTVTDSYFSRGSGALSGAIYISSSNCTVNSSLFREVTGHAFTAYPQSDLALISTTITEMSSGSADSVIYLIESTLNVTNSTVSRYYSDAIYGNAARRVSIVGSTFDEGKGALVCEKCRSVAISESFVRKQHSKFGALRLVSETSEGNVLITDSTFEDSESGAGGALYLSNYFLAITRSRFTNNTATETDGGALFLECSTNCSFSVADSVFVDNHAKVMGGLLRWKGVQPALTNLTYSENTAPYGPEFASFPVLLQAAVSRRLSDNTTITVAPGQDAGIEIVAKLIDHYGQVVSSDSSSYSELTTKDLSAATVSGISKTVADRGVFRFRQFQLFARPGSTVQLQVSTSAIADGAGTRPSVDIEVEMRDCVPGETRTEVSCIVCGRGTYSFNASEPCMNCPNNAECLGRTVVLPSVGYWKADQLSATVYECPRTESCLGGNQHNATDPYGFCASGYKSNLCQSCAPHYFRSGKNTCAPCPDFTSNLIQTIFIAVGAVLAVIILVWSSIHSALRETSVHSIYFKIMMNYVQVLYLVSEIDMKWPSDAADFLELHRSTGGVAYYAFSPDCLLGGTEDTSATFYRKIIMLAVFPVAILFVATAVWSTVALITRKAKHLKEHLLSTLVVVFFFIHPTLVQAFFSIFSCKEIRSGEYWLTLDLATQCWQSEHFRYVGSVGVPAVLVWILGIPTLILSVLIRHRKRLSDLSLRKSFGFLTTGYHDAYFYWEFVILFRKIAIICISSFFNDAASTQALGVFLVLILYTFWSYLKYPYTSTEMNRLEFASVVAADLTLYSGLFYLSGDLSYAGRWFFLLVLAVPNCLFILYWLYIVLISLLPAKGIHLDDGFMHVFIDTFPAERLKACSEFSPADIPQAYHSLLISFESSKIPHNAGTVHGYRYQAEWKSKYEKIRPLNNSMGELMDRHHQAMRVHLPSFDVKPT